MVLVWSPGKCKGKGYY